MTYIAVEGIDGAGKSTVCRLLADRLRQDGHDVVVVREPGGTQAGEGIREILLGHGSDVAPWTEALLFAAARAQLAATVVAPALEAGSVVVSDRSYWSSLAYQGWARGLGVDIVRTVNEAGLQGVVPDVVVLLRLPPADGLAREDEADRISAEGLALQERVAAGYDRLAAEHAELFVVVDADRDLDRVIAQILEGLEGRL